MEKPPPKMGVACCPEGPQLFLPEALESLYLHQPNLTPFSVCQLTRAQNCLRATDGKPWKEEI